MTKWGTLIAGALALAPLGGAAQQSAVDDVPPAETIVATPVTGPIRIDGVLDDVAWRDAPALTALTQRNPDEGEPVSERTEVRILVGDEGLYVGARLFDSEPDLIRARLARRDAQTDSDLFAVLLDARHDHLTAVRFAVNPTGSIQDAAIGANGNADFSWDAVWESAAQIDAEGWSVEMHIPFSQLRFEQRGDAEWGLQIVRSISRKQETSYYAHTPRDERLGVNRYGHLRGLDQVQEPSRLEIMPYVLARSEHLNIAAGNPFRSGDDQTGSAGLDLKLGLAGDLTLNATINPDFGQVEVDPAVINVTAFETFFPERRPFFVEGAELFGFGHPGFGVLQPNYGPVFYSRRVGRAPQRALGGPDYQYVDAPGQSTIAGAGKITGRVGDWSLGLIQATTTAEDARFLNADGIEDEAPVEPLTNYVTGRVRRELNEGNTVFGGVVTGVNRDLEAPALSAALHGSAYTAGLDFEHTWEDRSWFVNASFAGSRVSGSADALARTQRSSSRYFQRPDAGHVDFDPTRTSLDGYRATFSAGRRAGGNWRGAVLYTAKSPGWEINDAGFETNVDRHFMGGTVQYSETAPTKLTRFYWIDVSARQTLNFDGDDLGRTLNVGSVQQWSNFWTTSLFTGYTTDRIDDGATRGGPLTATPGAGNVNLFIQSDSRKPYRVQSTIGYAWNFRNGWGFFPTLGVTLRPSPALEVTFQPNVVLSKATRQYVAQRSDELATETHGGRYVFSDLRQTTMSLQTRVNWTFTPTLTLQLFAQPFVAAGDYRRFKELNRAGAFDFDLYGRDRGTIDESQPGRITIDPDAAGPAQAFVLPDPDFNFRSLRGNAVLRWEYQPGSTLFFVWQQGRQSFEPTGEFDFAGDYGSLFRSPPENIFVIKASYWFGG